MAITLLDFIGPYTSQVNVSANIGTPGTPGTVITIDTETMSVVAGLGSQVLTVDRTFPGPFHFPGANVAIGTNPTTLSDAPGGYIAESFPRMLCPEVNLAAFATTQIFNQLIWLQAGTVVTNITFCSAATGAGTPTHYSFGLYTYSTTAPALLATTADQTSTAWTANTILKLALTAPYTITTTGWYYVAIGMVATTNCTLKGLTARTDGTLANAAPILAGINATAISTTLPATIGATTGGINSVWVGIS